MQTQSDLSNLSADQLRTLAAQLMVEVEHKDSVIKQQDEVIERKINAMLTRPDGITLSKIKDMKQALELIEKMTAKYSKDKTAKTRGLSDEAAENIRKKIMGINKK